MSRYSYTKLDRFNEGRERAKALRARGLHTGKSAQGWSRKVSDYAPDPEEGAA